jgi:hypothetical protein
MAISPNDDFTAGQVLTATECNQFPRGVMARATSTTSYTMTTSEAIVTTELLIMNRKHKQRQRCQVHRQPLDKLTPLAQS